MKVAYKSGFLKSLAKLKDARLKKAILRAIDDAEKAESIADIRHLKKLKGYENHFRIRTGDYRIGLKWEEEEHTLYFAAFGHRQGIYDVFP